MWKSLFEQMSGTYEQQGDYILPNLTLPAEEKQSTRRKSDDTKAV